MLNLFKFVEFALISSIFSIRSPSSACFRSSVRRLLRSLVKGQDHSFFKDLTGVFCTVGGTLVKFYYGFFEIFKVTLIFE
jgi:hypothetical protein